MYGKVADTVGSMIAPNNDMGAVCDTVGDTVYRAFLVLVKLSCV